MAGKWAMQTANNMNNSERIRREEEEEENDHKEKVLKRLEEAGLKVKLTKCEFLKLRIKFLGHEVDEKGIHTVDDKIAAVAKFLSLKQ